MIFFIKKMFFYLLYSRSVDDELIKKVNIETSDERLNASELIPLIKPKRRLNLSLND